MKAILTIIIFFLSLMVSYGQNWITQSENFFNNGFHQKSIDLIRQNINQPNLAFRQKSRCYLILADNYLTIGNTENFKKYIEYSFRCLKDKSGLDSSLYFSNLSNYNHFQLRTDSSTFYAIKSLKLLESNFKRADSVLISRVYKVYANSMRNAIFHYPQMNNWKKGDSLILMRKHSIRYAEKALSYANKYQKPDVLRVLGNIYNDLIAQNQDVYKSKAPLIGLKQVFLVGINYYEQAINLAKKNYDSPSRFLSQCYSLLGLSYQYMKKYKIADSLYDQGIHYSTDNNKIKHLNEYNTAISWQGWNYESWYKSSNDIKHLKKSLSTYEKAVNSWNNYYKQVSDPSKGLDDAYRISTNQKISSSCYSLFELTKDHSYINKALYYSDLDAYPTYIIKRKLTDSITVEKLQKNLKKDETLIVYLSSNYPNKIHALIISKTKVHFLFVSERRIRINQQDHKDLNGLGSQHRFRTLNYTLYNYLFHPIDSLLTRNHSENIIIIPTAEFSQVNFDLFISDTLSNNWKDQPYMFHKYNISYGLSPSILYDNYKFDNQNDQSIGIFNGNFKNRTNLIFSEQLTKEINETYSCKVASPSSLKSFEQNVKQHDIILLIGHGQGNYATSNSSVFLNDFVHIDSDQLMNMKLHNSLFITTACSTNQSSTYMSEGNTGGFTKSIMYSGIKSAVTTFWDIDDKTNAFIMTRFFRYLSEGKSKSTSLWLAKKDYWNNCKQEEEFKPFFWSPYRLTGNNSSVIIKKKKALSYYYLLILLIIPLGFMIKRKLFS